MKPTKEMVRTEQLLDKIDLLVALIDEDINNFVKSIDPSITPATRKKFRKQSDAVNETLLQAAKEFSNEREV